MDKVEQLKDDDEAIKEYGVEVCTAMCKKVLDAGIPGLHMYTLNLEKSAMASLYNLGLVSDPQWKPASAKSAGNSGCTTQ